MSGSDWIKDTDHLSQDKRVPCPACGAAKGAACVGVPAPSHWYTHAARLAALRTTQSEAWLPWGTPDQYGESYAQGIDDAFGYVQATLIELLHDDASDIEESPEALAQLLHARIMDVHHIPACGYVWGSHACDLNRRHPGIHRCSIVCDAVHEREDTEPE